MERIRSLRVPNSNIQMIQQTTMLRYRALFHFMLEHHPQLANELKQAYMNTMRWYYSHHFDRFKRILERVKIENKTEMLGNDESRRAGLFSSGKVGLAINDPFHLGDRIDILREDNGLVSMQAKDLDRPVCTFICGTDGSICLNYYSGITIRHLWIMRRVSTSSSLISWEPISRMTSPPSSHSSSSRPWKFQIRSVNISSVAHPTHLAYSYVSALLSITHLLCKNDVCQRWRHTSIVRTCYFGRGSSH